MWLCPHRPGSVAVNVSLVFGGHAPGPSPCEVLWALYRKVKSSGQMLGKPSLAENSLTSDGESHPQPLPQCFSPARGAGGHWVDSLEGFSFCPDPEAAGGAGGKEGPGASRTPTHGSTGADLITLARETISICFTAMKPFLPQLLVRGSVPFVLLEGQILQEVTPVVSGFYKVSPQERPLLLLSNADQWVAVFIKYKFQTPVPTHLQGLANHLAQNIRDPILQKSSIVANGEKAELVLSEVWLQILGQSHTKALEDRASPEFWALQGQLSRWVKCWDEGAWGRGPGGMGKALVQL
ncbi:Taste receptor cell protein 1 [Plecturocebus cupreus]